MGKGKGKNKNTTNHNVFKVAGARSLKAKNKAKAVTTHLKKLTEVTKKQTVEVDMLLQDLQETVRQASGKKSEDNTASEISEKKETRQEKVEKFLKTEENSAQALEKLNKMEV